ncbi:ester cyclase [Mucilaginibacter sp. CAU 1740]|uniref:ester cyclase n=1 Tax=Mucilaginibacter sp. CAU 1740 TaxID=3140365 RepID=UPI00325B4E80
METNMEDNKVAVRRFNQEVIAAWDENSFNALMHQNFVNRSAPMGMDSGKEGMRYFFNEILRPAIPNISVTIHQQVAEGDWVTTRKTISGTHTGNLLGIPATGKAIQIDVIDIVRLQDGKYIEHWGITTLPELLANLSSKA